MQQTSTSIDRNTNSVMDRLGRAMDSVDNKILSIFGLRYDGLAHTAGTGMRHIAMYGSLAVLGSATGYYVFHMITSNQTVQSVMHQLYK